MWFVFLVLLLGGSAYLYWLNDWFKDEIVVVLRQGVEGTAMPLGVLVFLAALGGAILAGVTSSINRGRRAMRRWSARKTDRKKAVADEFYRKGMMRLLMGDVAVAREQFAQSLDVFPDYAPARVAEVEAFLKLGDTAGAKKRIAALVAREPKNLDYAFKLAQVLMQNGEHLSAAEELRRIISQDGRRHEWWTLLARCYRNSERWEDALETVEKAIKMGGNPAELDTLQKETAFLRAKSLDSAGDSDGALRVLKSEFSDHSDFVPAHLLWSTILQKQDRGEDAAEHLEKCYARSGAPLYLPAIEDLWIGRHEPNRMIRLYRKAVAEHADSLTVRMLYSNLLLRLGLIDESLDQLHELEESGQNTPLDAHLLSGEAHYRRQNFEKACVEYRKSLGPENQLVLSYTCETCKRPAPAGYQDACPSCGTINGLRLSLA
ncbi:MAG: tetratricopeptide repeat protein [Nitrospirae bacterium]|nr:tetratricopeptide repeat protein [Nitrospirota bacterium]